MSIRRFVIFGACFAVTMLLGGGVALAQDEATCQSVMSSAINQASTQCATAGTDTACYGYPQVEGVFQDAAAAGTLSRPEGFFSTPGSQADLLTTETIRTGPLDFSTDTVNWGLAFINAQAGLPGDLLKANNGKGVIYVMFGGVEIENGVEPADAVVLPDSGMPITTIAPADLRLAPVAHDTATSTNVVLRLSEEATLSADAVTPDGNWVRVVAGKQMGWVSRQALQPDADLSALAVLGPDSFTPMQSFYFRDGIREGVPENNCAPEPSMVLVQGPEDVPVTLRVHGVDMRLESTALLRTLPFGDRLGENFEIMALYGMVTLFPDTNREVLIPPGFVGRIHLGDFVSLGIEGDRDERSFDRFAGPIRPITRDEANLFRIIERLPGNILHYPCRIPHHVQPSGIGGPVDQLVFDSPAALNKASRACQDGRLPGQVCAVLGL